jgi:hypothetical protein
MKRHKIVLLLVFMTSLLSAQKTTIISDTLNVKLYTAKSSYPVLDTLMYIKGMFDDTISQCTPWKVYFDEKKTKLAYESYMHGDTCIVNQYWRSNGNLKVKKKSIRSQSDRTNFVGIYWETHCENGQVVNKYNCNTNETQHIINYYCNGNKMNEFVNVGYDWEGPFTTWFENGQMESNGHYSKTKKQGKWQYWDENGKFIKEELYKDGVLLNPEK